MVEVKEFLAHVGKFRAADVVDGGACLSAEVLIDFVESLGVVHWGEV